MKSGKKNPTPDSAEGDKKGEARDFVAKKVGLRSGHEVDRAITAENKIDTLKEEGRILYRVYPCIWDFIF